MSKTKSETEELIKHNPEMSLTVQDNAAIFDSNPVKAFDKMKVVVDNIAKKLTDEIYISQIQGNPYPKVEWWTTVGGTLGLFPVTEWSRRIERDEEILYEARVTVRHNGNIITAGEAICSNLESNKVKWDEHAVKSMAITRATSKAYRIGLSMLAVMAGLKPTSAEEMDNVQFDEKADRSEPINEDEWTGEKILGFGKEFTKSKWNNPNIKIDRLEFYAKSTNANIAKYAELELARRAKSSDNPDKGNPKIEFMKQMSNAKEALGDIPYYLILKKHGFEHSNLVPTVKEMDAIYKDMQAEINRNENEDDLPF